MSTPTEKLLENGVAIWLDDLSRQRIRSGNLDRLITDRNVLGVTTNPTIFAAALANGESYREQVAELAAAGADVEEAVFELTTRDVADACDIFAPVAASTGGQDGRVSIEVDPLLARDAEGTVASALKIAKKIDKDNLLVKIPATREGLRAITEVLAEGISVNVTLIFSLQRYRDVINAFMLGLEKAKQSGRDLSGIHSVASFFVSRVDSEVDGRLAALGSEQAESLKGKAGIANARLAYRLFQEQFSTERWENLKAQGANLQRPLWASTGVKDPNLPDTLYVTELVAPDTVNTMPEKTLEATFDHAEVTGDAITGTFEESDRLLDELARLGIDYNEVVEKLETEGLEKFVGSWKELLATVETALGEAGQETRGAEA